MYAWTVDEAASRLRELRHEEWGDLGLGALALGLAVAAAEVRPALAVPLFVGGLVVGVLGLRAVWRRWELVDRLAGERDAYVIPDVLAYAAREATMDRRRGFAAMLRCTERLPGSQLDSRVRAAAAELEALARELEDETLELDPACAVACSRLVTDVAASPLLNPQLPSEDLRSRVTQIRAGLRPRRLAG
jgi:hypothetical protein